MDSIYSQGGGGGLIRETKVPMQELELKNAGGAYARGGGGVIAGFYGYSYCNFNASHSNDIQFVS